MIDYQDILDNGTTISSSGTTGEPKMVYRSPVNLKECIAVALKAQNITSDSRILTVTRMTHAGGLLTQTLPAYSIGAKFKVQQFNAFTFLDDFSSFTHTFLAPAQMTALMNTKRFADADFSGKRILGGSDPMSWEMIESFVERGAIVQPNWGMSEIGPITINVEFDNMDKVQEYKKKCPDNHTVMGDTFYCDWKIIDSELHVKSPMCIYDDWFATGDLVSTDSSGIMYYHKRK